MISALAMRPATPRPLRAFLMAGAVLAASLLALGSLGPSPAHAQDSHTQNSHAAEEPVNDQDQLNSQEPMEAEDTPEVTAEAGSLSPVGSWLLEDVQGGGVLDRVRAQLDLTADGHASGSGGCNRFTGQATLAGEELSFGPLASTRMACTEAVMNQEFRYFKALEEVRGWTIDAPRQKLHLQDKDGKTLLTFSAL